MPQVKKSSSSPTSQQDENNRDYANTHRPTKARLSIVDMAEACGLLELSPSDLVCETNFQGISYYDFVLSSSITGNSALTGGATLYLCKFDTNTNLESMETVTVPSTVFTESGLPATDIALAVLGMLTFREQIARSKVLCLVRTVDQDCMNSLEVLKKVAAKFKCLHHVQASVTHEKPSASLLLRDYSTSAKRFEGMRLRILLCQSRNSTESPPASAVREAKALLEPSKNPLLCICFSLT